MSSATRTDTLIVIIVRTCEKMISLYGLLGVGVRNSAYQDPSGNETRYATSSSGGAPLLDLCSQSDARVYFGIRWRTNGTMPYGCCRCVASLLRCLSADLIGRDGRCVETRRCKDTSPMWHRSYEPMRADNFFVCSGSDTLRLRTGIVSKD